ncbi:MAG: XisH family protein [Saprospiraceae bacterium]|nr:XisH family protein [Saprospiraceae bacterium]MCF8250355.1 XisH family protein [Saprospiraceae bacterium]MCF8280408.1 XisH family protein [Bacteroidales bacterium]MCF8312163.1 XisH family protein [Saprospiraceae bacterium]MCF8441873.1 XisH family protein [Saprospiraceae bacterium]
MARRDIYHNSVRNALEKEGWTITDDPLDLTVGEVELFADLGAERVIAAERGNEKIAVEIKSFVGQSPVSDFHKAIGQYENYRLSLEELDPVREIWLAVPGEVWNDFFQRPFIQKAINRYDIKIIVFNPEKENVESWIK